MTMSPALANWLSFGERGASSNAIVEQLTGLPTCRRFGSPFDHPHDPDDLRRCRLLLEAVPEIAQQFHKMAAASPTWALLVQHWAELCRLMDQEAPAWRSGHGRAPATFELMQQLCQAARDGRPFDPSRATHQLHINTTPAPSQS
jgi:hypothetical protein